MNHIAASFIRITIRRVTEGALPPCERLDEWAIYQQDLEMARLLAQAAPDDHEPSEIISNGSKVEVISDAQVHSRLKRYES